MGLTTPELARMVTSEGRGRNREFDVRRAARIQRRYDELDVEHRLCLLDEAYKRLIESIPVQIHQEARAGKTSLKATVCIQLDGGGKSLYPILDMQVAKKLTEYFAYEGWKNVKITQRKGYGGLVELVHLTISW